MFGAIRAGLYCARNANFAGGVAGLAGDATGLARFLRDLLQLFDELVAINLGEFMCLALAAMFAVAEEL